MPNADAAVVAPSHESVASEPTQGPARGVAACSSCKPLEPAQLAAARAAISELGLSRAAQELQVPRNTLAAAAGGSRIREGTRMVIAARLEGRASKESA